MRVRPTLVVLSVLMQSWLAVPSEGVVFVKAGGSGSGTSWADAFGDLQAALAVAQSGDELWVAEGTWLPGAPGNTAATFALANGVALYGGFAGVETNREQRDPGAHPTILSGDLGEDDVYEPWPTGWNIGTANARHVVTASGVGASAVLDGFTILAGYASSAGGGGVTISAASPTIEQCRFVHNSAAFNHGGGILVAGGDPAIRRCEFLQNYVHLGHGAGIEVSGTANPLIEDCRFSGNIVVGSSPWGAGGGISIESAGGTTIRRCTFEDNIARNFYPAGDYEIAWGGAVFNFADGLVIDSCVFRRNHAHAGGAVSTWGDQVTIANSLFEGNVVTPYDLNGGGTGGNFGAGIAGTSFYGETTRVVNCVLARNHGGEGVGVASLYGHLVELRNSILWGNVATGQDISHLSGQVQGNVDFRYSCVEALFEPVPGEDPPDPANFPGCLDTDPRFVALSTGDLRLNADSPCIDAGENAVVPAYVTSDLDGRMRRFDAPGTPDTGLGTPPLVDLGPYEFGSESMPAPEPAVSLSGGIALRMFPNPARGPVRIAWADAAADSPAGRANGDASSTDMFAAVDHSSPLLELFGSSGRLIRRLPVPSGTGEVTWDGRDEYAQRAPAGAYFARLRGAGTPATGRVLLLPSR